MALYCTEWSITSDISPECASRVAEHGRTPWRLSWLPDRALTREQARAGMELDELLSDPENVHDYAAMARADQCAGTIGMLRAHVVILLARRMAARLPVAVSAH
ncbi:hypothetical protein NONI108955_24925 [Nocardia ninae]|uniref:Uncharacterized protein n=1 Tax=Nocardia ninae NBRC 108245 TaxID=1210091 RepID=A0A511M6S5_9NOCA|nr:MULTISPECIES: hypothetical protein [Nocardia]GEM35838.1 hypothetical protein NN4_03570 [Nocardia ninae NBRC 108245]